jgi:hypothetical protein
MNTSRKRSIIGRLLLVIAALTIPILINLSINGYMATHYAMQVTLTYSWGVAGGLLLSIATALLIKPTWARRLLRRQQDAFAAEVARLGSAAPDERDALVRLLRRRARMATVWWQGLTHERDRQGSAESVLDMINRLPEIPVEA